jgi:hypothetical protein
VGAGPRERVTIDLRGLGTALRAHANSRQLTVAATARSLIAASLDASRSTTTAEADRTCDLAPTRAVKLTLRMRASAASLLSERARAAGLPYGVYVGTLLDGSPAPALALNHQEAVRALGVSTEQLAALSTDLNALIRVVSCGSVGEAPQFRERLGSVADDVRRHLALSSRLLTSLTSVAVGARRGPRRLPDGAR